MKALAALVVFLCALPAAAGEKTKFLIYLGPEAYHSSLFFTDKVRARPRLGGQVELPDGVIMLGEVTAESIPYGPEHLDRTEFTVGAGIHLTERLVLAATLADESTDYTNYNSASSLGLGAELRYMFPIGHDGKFHVVSILGFQYFDKVSLERDHTVPGTATPTEIAICTFFTLGLGDCSGNQTVREYASFPAARQWFAETGIGYAF